MIQAATDQVNSSKKACFTQIPNSIFRAEVSEKARLIWCYLLSHSEEFNPRYTQISQELGFREHAIKPAIDELIENGMLLVKKGSRNSNIYMIKQPESWKSVRSKKKFSTAEIDSTQGKSTAEIDSTQGKSTAEIDSTSTAEIDSTSTAEIDSTNNTKNNTKNNTHHTTHKDVPDGRIENLAEKVRAILKSLNISSQAFGLTRAIGLAAHNHGWTPDDIEALLPELELYLMGGNHKFVNNPYDQIYKWLAYYKKPLQSTDKASSNLRHNTTKKWKKEDYKHIKVLDQSSPGTVIEPDIL